MILYKLLLKWKKNIIRKITNKKINFPPKKQNPKKVTNSTGASRKKRDSKFAIFSKSSRTNLKKKATNNPKKPIKLEQTISKKTNSTEKKGLIIYLFLFFFFYWFKTNNSLLF